MLINLSLIQLWLGVNGRGPMTAAGIYQAVARPGRQCGVTAYPHRFRHHFSHTWLDRGGAERDLMELNGWTFRRCSPATAPAPAAATTASWTTPPDPAAQDTTRQLSHSVSYSTVPIPLSRAPIISADGRIAAASQLCANAPVLRAQPPAPARLLDRHPAGPATWPASNSASPYDPELTTRITPERKTGAPCFTLSARPARAASAPF